MTRYVDRLFAAIRPLKLLYLAIDGVAPRYKASTRNPRAHKYTHTHTHTHTNTHRLTHTHAHTYFSSLVARPVTFDLFVLSPGP